MTITRYHTWIFSYMEAMLKTEQTRVNNIDNLKEKVYESVASVSPDIVTTCSHLSLNSNTLCLSKI